MLTKRGKMIIGFVTVSLIVSSFIFGFIYGKHIGNLWQKDKQFTTNDNRLFYNITEIRGECGASDQNITCFQERTTFYFEMQLITSVIPLKLEYYIARTNRNLTLHIIGYYDRGACLRKIQISGYLIFSLDQIDVVDIAFVPHFLTLLLRYQVLTWYSYK